MSERLPLPEGEELRNLLLSIAFTRFRSARMETVHNFADEACAAINDRFTLTLADAAPRQKRYPPELMAAAEEAARAVFCAYVKGYNAAVDKGVES